MTLGSLSHDLRKLGLKVHNLTNGVAREVTIGPVNISVCRCRCRHAEDPATAHWNRDKLFATKTIFCVSYSINFILYSLAGANYRNAVTALCRPCCPTSGRFQPAVGRRTTPCAVRRLSGSTLGRSSDSGSAAACAAAAIIEEPRRVAVSAV